MMVMMSWPPCDPRETTEFPARLSPRYVACDGHLAGWTACFLGHPRYPPWVVEAAVSRLQRVRAGLGSWLNRLRRGGGGGDRHLGWSMPMTEAVMRRERDDGSCVRTPETGTRVCCTAYFVLTRRVIAGPRQAHAPEIGLRGG